MGQFSILLFNPLAEQRPGLSRLDNVFYAEGRSSTERRAKIVNLSAQCHERCLGVLRSGKLCLECGLCSERERERERESEREREREERSSIDAWAHIVVGVCVGDRQHLHCDESILCGHFRARTL
jgi:hypothetical protein